MSTGELDMFVAMWNREADGTMKLLRALPQPNTTFGPTRAGGRSVSSHGTSRRAMPI